MYNFILDVPIAPMSLNGTEHMYIITAKLHMMIYMQCYS
jgi:hypothetical protein